MWEVFPYALGLVATLFKILREAEDEWHEVLLAYLVLVMGWSASNISWLMASLSGLPFADGLIVVFCQFLLLDRMSSRWRAEFYWLSWIALGLDVPMCLWGQGLVYTILAIAMNVVFVMQMWVLSSRGMRG